MGALGLDLATFIGQLVSFLILLGLLIYFGYKPIRKMLDERSKRIKASMEQAEFVKEQAARGEEEVKVLLAKAHEEGQAIIAQAVQFGDRLKEEARQEAHQEAQLLVDKARTELEKEQDRIIDDLRREFVDTAILAAEKVIIETLDKEKHRRLVEEALEESATFRRN